MSGGKCLVLWYGIVMASAKSSSTKGAGRFVLGGARLEKISAVEGIRTRAATRRMFSEFDRKGLSPEQRRKAIFEKHAREK
ncbi:MAG: hypothetical protein ABSG76_07800 [Xanthobacteraceae bacterium]